MTRPTIRAGWPPFREWQFGHAIRCGDEARLARLSRRWLVMDVTPAMRILRRALRHAGQALASASAAFRRLNELHLIDVDLDAIADEGDR